MPARFFAILSLAALAVARSRCNTAPANCCDTVGSSADSEIRQQIQELGHGDLLGTVLASVEAMVALRCSPIVGTGANCAQQPVCCQNNYYGGAVNIGCSPLNIGF